MLQLNIHRKVVLTTLISVVLAILLVSAFALNSSHSIILKGTLERELPPALGEVANKLDAQLLLPITVSQTMASNSDYQQFIRDGENESAHAQVAAYLTQVRMNLIPSPLFMFPPEPASILPRMVYLKLCQKTAIKINGFMVL